jgi:hypothetical protein
LRPRAAVPVKRRTRKTAAERRRPGLLLGIDVLDAAANLDFARFRDAGFYAYVTAKGHPQGFVTVFARARS